MEDNCGFTWNCVISHLPSLRNLIYCCVFLQNDSLIDDVWHIFEEESCIRCAEILLIEGHTLHQRLVLADYLGLCKDKGGKLHCKTLLLLVGNRLSDSCDVLLANDVQTFVIPGLVRQDRQNLLLELRVSSADSYNAAVFRGFRRCLSSTLSTLALLLPATLSVSFVETEANLTFCVLQVFYHV